MECAQDIVTLLKDVATIITAAVAAIIAIKGYGSWKKQLRGKAEYDLARRLLRSVYKVKKAIRLVRNYLVLSGEVALAMRDAGIEIEDYDSRNPEHHALSQQAVYQRRWTEIQTAWTELEVDALEAEVLWGHDIAELLEPLQRHTKKLAGYIQIYLQNLAKPPRHPDSNLAREIEETIYERGEHDAFAEEIDNAVTEIENYLRPHLKLSHT